MQKPRVIPYRSPNFFLPGDMPDNKVVAVVEHGTAGGLTSSLAWLCNPRLDNPEAAVSANFVISKGGVIYELVPFEPGFRAYANGIINNPDNSLAWLRSARARHINPNYITVSIEHEASDAEMKAHASMPDAQFNSSINLTAYILSYCGLKATHESVVPHGSIDSKNKSNCPGVIFVPAYVEVLIDRYPELKP